ncbi:M4 family metallopeptidase, partial [Actinomadura mexicana]
TSPTCNGSTVTGIGIQKAGQIFMGGLSRKVTSWSHARARVATLQAAKQLFSGSTECNAVKAAWNAINVPAQSGEPTC